MTLIEIMVVVLILGILATLVGTKVLGQADKARWQAAGIQIKNFEDALDLFKLNCGYYPTTEQGLEALVGAPSGGRPCPNYDPEGYLKGAVPPDPWQNPYLYASPGPNGKPYMILSYGADGVEGGQDYNADVSN
jgi:general secretion pathway protein G